MGQTKMIFNLNFDDAHPETSDYIADCGGDKEEGVFRYIRKLIDEFPYLKITLFVVPNWVDKPSDFFPITYIKQIFGLKHTHHWINEPFRLDKHIGWCRWLNRYTKRENIEVAIHGLLHHNPKHRFHSAEFMGLPYEKCKIKLKKAEEIFIKSKLKFTKGFRPPGWGVSGGLFQALRELNYFFVSAYPTEQKIRVINGLVNIPQNWDIRRDSPEKGIQVLRRYGVLSAKGHIENRYGKDSIWNGLTRDSYENIKNLLEKLEKHDVRYLSMREIATLVKAE